MYFLMTKANETRKLTGKRVAKIFHDDKPPLSKSIDVVLKKKSHIMYDAGFISLLTLMTMKFDSISLFNTQVDCRKCSINIIDALFLKRKFCGNLNPPLSRRISGRCITDLRSLSNKYQNLISDDTVDDMTITQDIRCKYMGINLFDVSKNEVSSVSIVKKGFRHLVTEAIQNFARYISTNLDWPFGEAKGVLFDMKNAASLKMKLLLKEFFRPFASDKINCYNFVSKNCCMYINSGQDRCMNCLDSDLIKSLRRRCVRAIELRMNDNAISGCIKNQLIVGSLVLAQEKLDFVAKKIETISISQKKLTKQYYKNECNENGGLLVLPDKDVSESFSEDNEDLSDKCFDDKKVSENDLSRLISQECCKNMRKNN